MMLTQPEWTEVGEVLTALGLNGKDQQAYLALLSLGSATVTPLAKNLSWPVSTAQATALRLRSKGLVTVTARGSRHRYAAIEPARLVALAKKRFEEVQAVAPLLERLAGKAEKSGKTRIYYENQVAPVFLEALACKSKLVHEIVSGRDIQDMMGERLHFSRRRVRAGVHLRSLRVESREIKRYTRATHTRELREARFLPKELTFPCSVLFWDDTVALLTTYGEGLAVVVESPSLVRTFHQLFDLLWQLSRPMVTAQD